MRPHILLVSIILLASACRTNTAVAPGIPRDTAAARELHIYALRLASSWYPHDTERALELLDSAALLDPAHHDTHYLRFLLLDHMGRTGAALTALQEATALRPYDPVMLRTLGSYHEIMGDTLRAEVHYLRAERAFAQREEDAGNTDLPWQHTMDRAVNLVLLGHDADGRTLLQFARFTAAHGAQRDLVDHLLALPRHQLPHAVFPDREEVVERMLGGMD